MELKNSRVLITGGAGLIGSHIAELLTREPVKEIVIYDNFTRGTRKNLASVLPDQRVRVVAADILDVTALAQAIEGIDLVFHQAAIRITQCAEVPRLAMDVLGQGTFNVLEACVKAGVKKVVSASSASVYGMADAFPTTELHHPYNNRTIYGTLKTLGEGLLRSFNEMYGLPYVALRYFNVYGPRMDTAGAYTEVFIRWMERIAAGKPPLIFGDGTQTMDFVFVEDIARANLLAMQSDVSDKVFNVASGTETSLRDLADALLRAMDSNLTVEHLPERKVNPVRRRLADVSRARRELGFETDVTLDDGLKRLVSWWQAEQLGVAKEVSLG